MHKKFLTKLFLISLFFTSKALACECQSDFAAIILNEQNSKILFEKNAEKIIYPASLTKVMTLYLAFEALKKGRLKLSDKIKISAHAQDISNINRITTLHLQEGDSITVEEAIRATAIKSMNGAAVSLAEKIAGDEWEFAQKMNDKARQFGMFHTNFRNATGLHEDGQFSTAYDLARLLLTVQRDFKEYRKYFLEDEFVFRGQKFKTHNHFLVDYEGATGFKTGFTSIAGFNLMASATRAKINLSGVIVACESHEARDNFAMEIFDDNFDFVRSSDYQKEMAVALRR